MAKQVPAWQFDIIKNRIATAKQNFFDATDTDRYSSDKFMVPEQFTAKYLVRNGKVPMRSEKTIREKVANPCAGSLSLNCIFEVEEHPAYQHGLDLSVYIKTARKKILDRESDVIYKCKAHPEQVDKLIADYDRYVQGFLGEIKKRESKKF